MRTSLYVPGDRPERFDKALASGADAIILDLEDGVPLQRKNEARANVATWLSANPKAAPLVRINTAPNLRSADLETVLGLPLGRLVVPMATPEACDIDGADVVALVETAEGVTRLDEIAAVGSVVRIAIGEADLGEQLGMWPSPDGREFDSIRSRVVVASALAGLEPPCGPVPVDLDNLEALAATSEHLRRLGFGGRSIIHPKQVDIVNAKFSPSDDEIAWARSVVEADANAGGDIGVVDGGFVDAPIVARARRILGSTS